MKPIERMLEAVEWKVLGPTGENGKPYATHEGILKIGENIFRCYKLSNGMTVIDEKDLLQFFGGLL